MDSAKLYEQYDEYLNSILGQIKKENSAQNEINNIERQTVLETDNIFSQSIKELRQAEETVRQQYHNIWESCTSIAKINKPEDQRPTFTDISWQQAISVQNSYALIISKWVSTVSQKATEQRQRQRQVEIEEQQKAAALLAEKERLEKEEAERQKEREASDFVERLKNKFKNKNY